MAQPTQRIVLRTICLDNMVSAMRFLSDGRVAATGMAQTVSGPTLLMSCFEEKPVRAMLLAPRGAVWLLPVFNSKPAICACHA